MSFSAPEAEGQLTPPPLNVRAQKRPPSIQYITDFVRACFTEDLCEVDFTHSLQAMELLTLLEDRRKEEVASAIKRLSTDPAGVERDRGGLQSHYPGISDWILSLEDKAKRIEALYTQVYVGLRRWTLINEMRLTPFNKQNCIAMLNALYPPRFSPTSQLSEKTLNAQRNAYFRYIQAVEKNGKDILINLEQASRRPGESNGWPVVRDIVDVYLRKSASLIEEATSVKGPDDFAVNSKEKRTDSGVSFASTTSSKSSNLSFSSSSDRRPTIERRPVPEKRPSTSMGSSSPVSDKGDSMQCAPGERKTSGSTFERLTRELRRIKSRSHENKEPKPELDKKPSFSDKRPSLRKMKSTGGLNRESSKKDGKHSRENSSDRSAQYLFQYTIDDAQRERLIREARQDKENRKPRTASPQGGIYRPQTRDPKMDMKIEEELSPTSCRINRLDIKDPYRLPDLRLPALKA